MTSHALGAFHRLPREIRERTWDAYLDLCHINDQGYAGSKDSILNLMTMSKAIRADCKKVYDFHYWRQASLDLGLEGYHVLGDVTRYVFWLVLHDCTRINASIASLRLATPDLRPDDPPPLNGLRHVRKLNICLRYHYPKSNGASITHTAQVPMLANALSSLRELFLDLAPRHLPGNRGKDWRSYVQHVLAPILRSPSLKRIHIDNGVPGLEGMDITNFVQEIGCCLPDGKWRYDGLVIVGKEGSRYWHGITVQYTTPHDFDTEEERHWAEEHVGHYVFEAMS